MTTRKNNPKRSWKKKSTRPILPSKIANQVGDLPCVTIALSKEAGAYILKFLDDGFSAEWQTLFSSESDLFKYLDDKSGWLLEKQLNESLLLGVSIKLDVKNILTPNKTLCIDLRLIQNAPYPQWRGAFYDVTDRKTHETALVEEKNVMHTLYETTGTMLCSVTRQGHIMRCNRVFSEFFSYQAKGDLQHHFWHAHLKPADYALLIDTISQAMGTHQGQTLVLPYTDTFGRRKHVEWILSVMKPESYDEPIVIMAGTNITTRVIEEERINAALFNLKEKHLASERLIALQRSIFSIIEQLRNQQGRIDIFRLIHDEFKKTLTFRSMFLCLKPDKTSHNFVMLDSLNHFNVSEIDLYFVKNEGILGRVIKSQQTYYCKNVDTDDLYIPHHDEVKSMLMIPIVFGDFLWGVFGVDSLDYDGFTDNEIDMLKLNTAHLSVYLEESDFKNQIMMEATKMRRLHDAIGQIISVRDDFSIADHVVSEKLVDHLAIYRYQDQTLSLVSEAHGGHLTKDLMHPLAIIEQTAIKGSEKTFVTHDGTFHHAVYPIKPRDQVLGLIYSIKHKAMTSQELNIMAILSDQLGVYWMLNALIDKTKREALIDPLMNIWNRRYMIRTLEDETYRIKRYNGQAALVIIDLGDFKEINDTYGHVYGDQALIGIANVLKASMRECDVIGRYGGDEFIVLMPNTTYDSAKATMERVCEELKSKPITDLQISVNADFGIATVPHDGDSLVEVIKTADERMYLNKRSRKGKFISIQMG